MESNNEINSKNLNTVDSSNLDVKGQDKVNNSGPIREFKDKATKDVEKETKKSKNNANGKKSSNVFMKIFLVLLVLAIIAGIVYVVLVKQAHETAKGQLVTYFENLKAGKGVSDELNKVMKASPEDKSEVKDDFNIDPILLLFCKDLQYEIVGVSGDLNNIVVDCKVSNKDAGKLYVSMFTEILRISVDTMFSNLSEEEFNAYFIEHFNKDFNKDFNTDDIGVLTNDVSVRFEKVDGEWKIESGSYEDLANAVLPGIKEMIDNAKTTD